MLKVIITVFLLAFVPIAAKGIGDMQFNGVKALTPTEIVSQDWVKAKLDSDEKILWSSSVSAKNAVDNAMPGAYFGILLILVPIFSFARLKKLNHGHVPLFRKVFLVPFLLMAAYLLTTPYWAHKKAIKTVCLLTTERAYQLADGSVDLNVPYDSASFRRPFKLSQHGEAQNLHFYMKTGSKGSKTFTGFDGISDGESAEKILEEKVPVSD